ncbi:MAG: Rnase Y domain-containing protein, partial [Patescibacteria group bacterium]
MSLTKVLLLASAAGLGGAAIGYVFRWLLTLSQKGSIELTVKQTLLEAKTKAQEVSEAAEQEANRIVQEANEKEREKSAQLKKTEDRLIHKDELLDKRQTDIDREAEEMKKKIEELKVLKEKIDATQAQKARELERVAKLSAEDAKQELLRQVEQDSEEDLVVRMRKLEQFGAEKLEQKAKDILSTVIQRLSTSTVPDVMSTTVDIPSDDLKGKIIGKEGRNIRAFEKASGVEVIIDDTPGSIVLSSFDPVRRQSARVALENLIADGRIQPAKIEEMVEKAKEEISK